MSPDHFESELQSTIDAADRLRDHREVQRHEPTAKALDALASVLHRIEHLLSDEGVPASMLGDLSGIVDALANGVDALAPSVRTRAHALIEGTRGLSERLRASIPSQEIPSRPLLGVLPLARIIPQDVHSVMDYSDGVACLASGWFSTVPEARIAGAALGTSAITVAALTDYRLSARKVIPIEAHEAVDYLWGIAAIAAPFALGYVRKAPAIAAIHIATGIATILGSLVTDYRAARGIGRRR